MLRPAPARLRPDDDARVQEATVRRRPHGPEHDGARTLEPVGSSDPRNTLNFRELRGSCCQMS